jgi:hypothetical protein
LIGDYHASIFTYAFTFLARTKQTDDTLERRSQVDFSFVSIRPEAFESTGFGVELCRFAAHGPKPSGAEKAIAITLCSSHCGYIEDAREVSASVFTPVRALCFDKNPVKRESSGFQRIKIPLLPRSPAASQPFSCIYLFALFRRFPRLA